MLNADAWHANYICPTTDSTDVLSVESPRSALPKVGTDDSSAAVGLRIHVGHGLETIRAGALEVGSTVHIVKPSDERDDSERDGKTWVGNDADEQDGLAKSRISQMVGIVVDMESLHAQRTLTVRSTVTLVNECSEALLVSSTASPPSCPSEFILLAIRAHRSTCGRLSQIFVSSALAVVQ